MDTRDQRVFRLRGIPTGYNMDGVRALVRSAITRRERNVSVDIGSLAVDPRAKNRQVATLRFSQTPAALSAGQQDGQWPLFKVRTENGLNVSLVVDTNFLGFTCLHSPADTDWTMDIIAVTGLGGHAFGSFKQKGGTFMWLQDALPESLPSARIMTYGYDTPLVESESFQSTSDLAVQFNRAFRIIRRDPRVPLIMIGHSLGGILVKEALLKMHDRNELEDHMNLIAIRGILFFGVPNQGMAIESLIPMVRNQPNRALLKDLGRVSLFLEEQSQKFPRVVEEHLQQSQIVNFYETKTSPTARQHPRSGQLKMTGPPTVLVTRESATHGRPYDRDKHRVHAINRNHSDLVKFSSQFDDVYSTVLEYLQDMRPQISLNPLSPRTKPLRLLSISGSGYRGLGSLLTLRHLLYLVDPNSPPRPCEVFDMTAGSGTGGLIAVLLGRLELDIEAAINAYIKLSASFREKDIDRGDIVDLFLGDSKSSPYLLNRYSLGVALDRLVGKEKLLESTPKCKTFVLISTAHGVVKRLRNYQPVNKHDVHHRDIKIREACQATMATLSFLKYTKIDPVRRWFNTNAGGFYLANHCTDYSNPVLELLNEVEEEYPERLISAVLSVQDCIPVDSRGVEDTKPLLYAEKCSKLIGSNKLKEKVVQDMYCGNQGRLRNKYFSLCASVDASLARLDNGSVRGSMQSQIQKSFNDRKRRNDLQTCAYLLGD